MYCINCGAEIKSEYINCPYCGKALQMVPDYSIYDEDDINVILESTKNIESKNNKAYLQEQKEKEKEKERREQEAALAAKKKRVKTIVVTAVILCLLLFGVGIGTKAAIDHQNNNSYDYQMKQADEAMFKEKYDIAEPYYLQALALSPQDVRVRLKLADLYIANGNPNEAVSYLKAVLSIDAENYDAYKKLFQLYEDSGNVDAILDLKSNVTNAKILRIFEDYIVDEPSISLPGGAYEEALRITLTADKGMQIFYTTDGKNPISHGTLYKEPIEISDAGMHTIKMVALNSLGVYSNIRTETFVLEYDAPSDPEVSPNGGSFDTPTHVYITVPEGCSAYYTWDRSKPTASSEQYAAPILIPEGYNILSVIIIDNNTGLSSGIYRGVFEYTIE